MAGLVIAGPAGCVVGSQIGRTVLAVGAAVEGGMTISVLVMSLAAAAKFSHSSTSAVACQKERELKLPNTLVLVRPDIAVDPIWSKYSNEARESWEKMNRESSRSSWGSGIGSLFASNAISGTVTPERDSRYLRDSDIIKADASELAMRDKVFLLVNRILNDKLSLPGHVYRHLIRKHNERAASDNKGAELQIPTFSQSIEDVTTMTKAPSRSFRQDAHGIIKHVTATLLDVRPGLASSPTMTEMSALSVEVLVFGELYNDVFGEIVHQTREQDENLIAKVEELCRRSDLPKGEAMNDNKSNVLTSISHPAIAALKSIPDARTPADKLFHCVQFLECVSAHFSILLEGNESNCSDDDVSSDDISCCIDADTLLKMVCQHIVAAKVKYLHAEVVFIEEFSRDEQLLRGKEGYALITLQASLHYLDSLETLDSDLYPIQKIKEAKDVLII